MSEETKAYFRKELDIDIQKEFERLKTIGAIPMNLLLDREAMIKALNQAAYNEQMAKQMFLKARRLYEMHMIRHNQLLRPLEKRAMQRIKAWMKESGITASAKQITKEDVVKEMCAQQDTRVEYRKLIRDQEEMKEIRDACNSLSERWKSRSKLLNAQSFALNSKIEVDMGGRKKRRAE